ncbi:hypothetical protein PaecuDRAFT_4843, partial [Paenibacillus curdlanolyticus YK9]
PANSHSAGTAYGDSGCTSARDCHPYVPFWGGNSSYTQIYDKCVTDVGNNPVGDYYRETSYSGCC